MHGDRKVSNPMSVNQNQSVSGALGTVRCQWGWRLDGINTICLETDCWRTKEALQQSFSLAHGKCQVGDGSPAVCTLYGNSRAHKVVVAVFTSGTVLTNRTPCASPP